MTKPQQKNDIWDQIFNELILDGEPPIEYIKNATIITKNGCKIIISPADFAELVLRERSIDPELRDIQSYEVTINSSKVKRDVNKWTKEFFSTIESTVLSELKANKPKSKARKPRKKLSNRKID
jgi:hypothetical protein